MSSVPVRPTLQASPFLNLDADVLVHVLTFLSPLDTVRLRATCKWLRELSHARTVWISAIKSIIPRFQLPRNTLPLSNISTCELEEAAIRPYLFQKNVVRQPHPYVEARGVFSCPLQQGEYSRILRLIPGARWAIVGNNFGTVRLCDLHAYASEMSSLHIVSEMAFEGEVIDLVVQADDAGNGAVIFVLTLDRQDLPPHLEHWFILTLDLSADTPLLEKRAELLNNRRSAFTTIHGSLVATTTTGGSVIVWNWAEDTWVEILLMGQQNVAHDLRVKINGPDSITTFNIFGGTPQSYRLPPLHPRNSCAPAPTDEVDAPPKGSKEKRWSRELFSTLYISDQWKVRRPTDDNPSIAFLASRSKVVSFVSENGANYEVGPSINWTRPYFSALSKACLAETLEGDTVLMIPARDGRSLEMHAFTPDRPGQKGSSHSNFAVRLPSLVPESSPPWRISFCAASGIVAVLYNSGTLHTFDFASF
ncbi:hypothetical protein FRB99_000563 [Tulasnella sp. 403]|nr:hypothetical protein FRB99_000563 [Tulasnella sp. 403]